MKPYYVQADERDRMVRAYLAGASMEAAGASVSRSAHACQLALREVGIPARSCVWRRHALDTSCLRVVDTEQKAYFLGWWTADGWLYASIPGMGTSVAIKDKDHLLKLRGIVGSSAPITVYTRKPTKNSLVRRHHRQCRVVMYSAEMHADLLRHGITPTKSADAKPWVGPEHLMPHYWRGVFDGDGTISVLSRRSSKGTPYWLFQIVGTKAIADGFSAFAHDRLGVRCGVYPQANVFKVMCGRLAGVQKILRLLYDGATVSLDRKRVVAEEALTATQWYHSYDSLSASDLLDLFLQEGSWKSVGRRLGLRSPSYITRLRRRLGLPLKPGQSDFQCGREDT